MSSVDELRALFARQLVGPSHDTAVAPAGPRSPSPTIADVDVEAEGEDDPDVVVPATTSTESATTVEPALATTMEEGEDGARAVSSPQPPHSTASSPSAEDSPPSLANSHSSPAPANPAIPTSVQASRTASPAATIGSLMEKAGLSPSSGTSTPRNLTPTLERLVAMESLWGEFKSAFFVFEAGLGGVAREVHRQIESHKCPAAVPKEGSAALAATADLMARVEQLQLENYDLQVCERKALQEAAENKRLLDVFRGQLEQASKELQEIHEKCNQTDERFEEERKRHDAERKLRESLEKAKVESVAEHARLNLKTVELGKRYVVLEHDLEMANKEIKALHLQLGEAAAFVLVLVEAEARMFDPQLLKQGYVGGAQNATALRAGAEKLYSIMNSGECPRVVIAIYFDAAKVADELKEVGWVKNDSQVDDFLEGLSSWDLTTLSDVSGSFGASAKIKAQLGMLGSLRQCQMIVLVAGQDRKYIAKLDDLGPENKNKVMAIRSTPLGEVQSDPFRALGDDRLYHIPCVFPTSHAEWDSIRYRPAPRPVEPRAPTEPANYSQQQAPRRPEYNDHATPRPPSNNHMAQPTPANYGYQPQPSPAPGYHHHQSQQHGPQHGSDPRYAADRVQDRGHDRSDMYYSRAHDGNDYGYAASGQATQWAPQRDHNRHEQRSPSPRPETTSHPPWQEFRAFNQAVDSTPAQAQQQPTQRPRSPHIIRRRAGSSMGGSPASSDERNPPLPHIPAAARTHVSRPPTWRAGDDIQRPQTSNSLISTATGAHPGGGPPPNWRVNMTTYNQGYNHQGQYDGQGHQPVRGQYDAYSANSDDRVQQWRESSEYSQS